jgi:hypothetical protein
MLEQTFIHIPGVGKLTERELWADGIRCWDDADRFEKRFGRVGVRLQQSPARISSPRELTVLKSSAEPNQFSMRKPNRAATRQELNAS